MTEIAKRVDSLGRIVLPREVRKKLKIEEGTLLNIKFDSEKIIMQKSEPVKEFKHYILDVCSCVENCTFIVTSETEVVFINKANKLSHNEQLMSNLNLLSIESKNKTTIQISKSLTIENEFIYIFELTNYGDKRGTAIFCYKEKATPDDVGMMKFIVKYIQSKL